MFNFYKKKDSQIQADVMRELKWDPSISELNIKVASNDGIITLEGNASHFFDKTQAERIALGVGGVKGVASEIEVILMNEFKKTDEEIAKAALSALEWNYTMPKHVKVSVSKGWINLTGETEWNYQRKEAQHAVQRLIGVTGVTNQIVLKTKILPLDIKQHIEDALKRSAEVEGRNITVTVNRDKIILTGNVHSSSEIIDAELAAWKAPGVMDVINELKIAH